jgi:hypothetical protein
MMQSDYDDQSSYFGFVETRDDVVILIHACVQGGLCFIQDDLSHPNDLLLHKMETSFLLDKRGSLVEELSQVRYTVSPAISVLQSDHVFDCYLVVKLCQCWPATSASGTTINLAHIC